MRRSTLVLAAILGISSPASAQRADGSVDGWYFLDGGAVPLFWLPLAGALFVDQAVSPRPTPLGFDPDEGGAPSQRDREWPGWTVTAGVAVLGTVILIDDEPSRWYHLKGFAQSVATTSLATKLLKASFGRHRPDRDAAANTSDGHRSFPSGHASESATALTYFALYLRGHGFDRWREPGTVTWWEVATYAGLGVVAAGVSAERVVRDRHHVSDVVAGAALGAGTAAAIYWFQERRYRRRQSPATIDVSLPPIDGPQLVLGWSF